MRSVRTGLLGLAVVACAFGAPATTAFAKEKLHFGKFVASRAVKMSSHGSVRALTIGRTR
jgi:hypothetical protein